MKKKDLKEEYIKMLFTIAWHHIIPKVLYGGSETFVHPKSGNMKWTFRTVLSWLTSNEILEAIHNVYTKHVFPRFYPLEAK